HKLMAADKPVKASIHKAIEKIGKLNVEMEKMKVDCKLKVMSLLTPEQLKKLKEMKGEHKCCKQGDHEHKKCKQDKKKCKQKCKQAKKGCKHKH
ncbi:MAG: hypothetical protein GY858_00785, partial [Candidatus Omnitrophica bacterium]|nr:hypothetical protein [Candidatus Omnitrophota bacterium]